MSGNNRRQFRRGFDTHPQELRLLQMLMSEWRSVVPVEEGMRVVPTAMRLLDQGRACLDDAATAGALDDRDYSTARLDPSEALKLINDYRHEKGLKSLKLDPLLTAAAKSHSRDLAKHDRISHYGSNGSSPWDRVAAAGYKARVAAENIGTGQASLGEVIKGWEASEGHNKNLLLADAEHMGIALVQDPKTEFKTFWTLVVGAPL